MLQVWNRRQEGEEVELRGASSCLRSPWLCGPDILGGASSIRCRRPWGLEQTGAVRIPWRGWPDGQEEGHGGGGEGAGRRLAGRMSCVGWRLEMGCRQCWPTRERPGIGGEAEVSGDVVAQRSERMGSVGSCGQGVAPRVQST